MGRGKVYLTTLAILAVACVDKKQPQPCDPETDQSCNIAPGIARCTSDADCADGVCQADGTCKARDPVNQPTACANVSCPAGNFCSNGKCIPATPQCKQPDPACIFIPHGAFEPPVHAWWWPWKTPAGPDALFPGQHLKASAINHQARHHAPNPRSEARQA